jgi:prevent-host-death family protein
MYTIGTRAARAEFASILRRAEHGESTLITDRGEPVAVLGPLGASAPTIDQLIASGAVIPPRRSADWRQPEPVRVWAGTRLDQALRDLRG